MPIGATMPDSLMNCAWHLAQLPTHSLTAASCAGLQGGACAPPTDHLMLPCSQSGPLTDLPCAPTEASNVEPVGTVNWATMMLPAEPDGWPFTVPTLFCPRRATC